ncbi:MAG: glycosyltransferase [Planctomycetota bacterium]|nr:glycosyltransferase [Planctomycetota bacterium]MDA1166216.1 glycosyltransferase [Planctomycetota bacterium]
MSRNAKLVSVVIPICDHRDQVYQSIESFLNQSMSADDMEIVVLCDGVDLSLEREIAGRYPLLRLIPGRGSNVPALYNVGVEAASGRFVYISEMHCVAEPDCLEEAIRFILGSNATCAASRSDGINGNLIAEGEQRIFENDIRRWRDSGKGKVTIRGFLIERSAWNRAGGLRSEFGHYSEVMLGQRLEALGERIGYADRSMVHHCNQSDLESLTAELIDYGVGECRSNAECSPAERLGVCHEWVKFANGRMSGLRLALQQTKATLSRQWSRLIMALFSSSPEIFQQAYLTHWKTAIRIGRLRYIESLDRSARGDGLEPLTIESQDGDAAVSLPRRAA